MKFLLKKKSILICLFLCSTLFFNVDILLAQDGSQQSLFLENKPNKSFPAHSEQWLQLEAGIFYLTIQKKWTEPQEPSENIDYTVSNIEINKLEIKDVSVLIHALKFDPNFFDFSVFSAKWNENKALSMEEWVVQKNLIAGINSSMYLPDKLTSNGYLRKGDLVNNKHIGKNLGGFFLANPKEKNSNLPNATIIYSDEQDFSTLGSKSFSEVLEKYQIVVQNFKLINFAQDHLSSNNDEKNPNNWRSQRKHSVAAIAEDYQGQILFLFSEQALTVGQFIKAIENDKKLNLKKAIYTEGGSQASMAIYTEKVQKFWLGQNNILLMIAGENKIPNIIGIRRK